MRRLSLLLAALAPLPMAAQAPYGPLSSQESGPLQRVGFTHVVDRADLVETGAIQFESWVGYSNIFENDSSATHHLNMDLERLSTDIGVRWGAKRRLEAGARFAFETTGGGVLDGFITDWHKLFGLPDADRGKYPFGAYAQMLTDATGKVRLDLPKRTMALEDVRLSAKWRAWQSADGRKLLSLSGIARLPIEDDHVGPRRVDVAASALARSSWTRWHLHGTVGAATVREAQDYDGLLRGGSFFADVALERARTFSSRLSAVAQISLESPRLQGFDEPEIDGWPVNLVLGMSGQLGERWSMDVGFSEDIPPESPAADFTLGIGIRRTW